MNSVDQLLLRAREELETAQLLLDNGRYRVCISRAYYAMFYGIQALLKNKNIPSRTHKGTIQQFSQHFVKSGDCPESMAQDLKRNYDLRQQGDYDATSEIDQADAEQALTASVNFVAQVQDYFAKHSG